MLVLRTHHGHALLRSGIVAIALYARVYYDILVSLAQESRQALSVPSVSGLLPVAIKPIQVWLVLVEFAKLVEVELEELLPSGGVVFHAITCIGTREIGIIRVRPIYQRIIQSEFKTMLAHLLHERRHDVALCGRGLHGVEVAILGIPQGHAIVVLCGENGIPGAALLNEVKPSLRIVVLGGEAIALAHILLVWQVLVVKRPALRNSIDRVYAIMNEDTQLGVVEPLHALVFLLLRLCI